MIPTITQGESPMRSVSQILKSKPDHTVHSVTPATPVVDAVKLMAEKNIGAVLVIEDAKIVGIFTERDYVRKFPVRGLSSSETRVHDIMATKVIYVRPEQTNEECMALMTNNRFRHLPVLDNGKLVGLISIGDLVNDIISEQKFTINQLVHYITGDAR
jgi:CBS domain-containing protein